MENIVFSLNSIMILSIYLFSALFPGYQIEKPEMA